jgi:prevent-host-death family protein
VRELRQNLSVYLARVIAGERLEVTDHGHPVALLIPLPPAATLVERLVAEGRAIPASGKLEDRYPSDIRVSANFGKRVQQALRELREDSR